MKRISIQDKRFCSNCGSDKTYVDKHGYEAWRKHDGRWLCHNCYCRLVLDPRWSKIKNKRRLTYKGKQVFVKFNPRKGVCAWCGVTKIKTHLHHEKYDDENPLANTVELCEQCHLQESIRLGQLTGRPKRYGMKGIGKSS